MAKTYAEKLQETRGDIIPCGATPLTRIAHAAGRDDMFVKALSIAASADTEIDRLKEDYRELAAYVVNLHKYQVGQLTHLIAMAGAALVRNPGPAAAGEGAKP